MVKLNQIIAVEKGVKNTTLREVTDAYKLIQKPEPLSGISRVYTPKFEDGDQLPSESTLVQVKVDNVLGTIQESMTKLFDVTLTKEVANTEAKANVVVDGKTIIKDVPVTYLLFLEKQLTDLGTVISKLPRLNPGDQWNYSEEQACYATNPIQTVRTKKVLRNHVRSEATEKHPAQVDVYNEEVMVGTWNTTKYSGALPADRINELARRIEALKTAVKYAREEANSIEVTQHKAGKNVFDYLFS